MRSAACLLVLGLWWGGCSESGTPPVASVPGAPGSASPADAEEASRSVDPLRGAQPEPRALAQLQGALPIRVVPSVRMEGGDSHSVQELRAFTLLARVENARGEHEVTVELLTPAQTQFERRSRRLTFDGTAQELAFEFPVAGTLIQHANLAGRWSVHFLLDGQEVAAESFELLP